MVPPLPADAVRGREAASRRPEREPQGVYDPTRWDRRRQALAALGAVVPTSAGPRMVVERPTRAALASQRERPREMCAMHRTNDRWCLASERRRLVPMRSLLLALATLVVVPAAT